MRASWSHDGKWLYSQSRNDHSAEDRIFRCPASGGNAVAHSAPSSGFPWESFDGETLHFANLGDKITVHMVSLCPAGTESTLRGMPAVLDPSQWTVVPGGIYFVPVDAPKSIRYFDFATKQGRQIFAVDKDFQDSLSVCPMGAGSSIHKRSRLTSCSSRISGSIPVTAFYQDLIPSWLQMPNRIMVR